MNYKLKKDQEVLWVISRRVNRPGAGIGSCRDLVTQLNIRIGNPKLKPEFINSINAGYQEKLGKAILLFLFMMQKQNGFMRVSLVNTTSNISYVTNKI
ncbi:MAG: outer membrane beta-barrel protein [Bacteroidetes bacterium]|nr:outer membrane beta-barrel protein [Bacteroidota bacterium]